MKTLLKRLKIFGLTCVLILALIPAFQAFEAHFINVTAEIISIDPPIMIPPGATVAWDDPVGGTLTAPTDVYITATSDEDATHVYFNFGPGINRSAISDPVCGGSNGGPKSLPLSVLVSEDFVIKAIACNGADASSQKSVTNTKIYTFELVETEPLPAEGSVDN